jgi:hypothetical protein
MLSGRPVGASDATCSQGPTAHCALGSHLDFERVRSNGLVVEADVVQGPRDRFIARGPDRREHVVPERVIGHVYATVFEAVEHEQHGPSDRDPRHVSRRRVSPTAVAINAEGSVMRGGSKLVARRRRSSKRRSRLLMAASVHRSARTRRLVRPARRRCASPRRAPSSPPMLLSLALQAGRSLDLSLRGATA